MTTLQIDKDKAATAYKNGDATVKKLLDDLFGDKTFKSVMERIKTFDDACVELGITTEIPFEFDDEQNSFFDEVVTRYKLSVIAKALQEGWKPDWTNRSQKKWYLWFEYKSGVGFVVHDTTYDYTYTFTSCGSRLCFKTSELADYFNEQFADLLQVTMAE